jgi:putative ABC transport system permease protein
MGILPEQQRRRIRPRDVLGEAWRATRGRASRTLLTAAGVALGISAAVATIGVSTSAGSALSDRFNALEATLVTVKFPAGGRAESSTHPPGDVAELGRQIHGVRSLGFMATSNASVAFSRLQDTPASEVVQGLNLVAAQSSVPEVLASTLIEGREFDVGVESRHDRAAIIDSVAARTLGISTLAGEGQVIYIGGIAHLLVGIIAAQDAQLTGAVIVPYWEVEDPALHTAEFRPTQLVARTSLGAATQVGEELPLALSPGNPDGPQALVPPTLDSLKQSVQSDTRSLFLGLAAVSLLVGALGVGNTMTLLVSERRAEIGLRRALGAGRTAIAGQFLLESAMIGGVGGVLGTLLGFDLTVAVCLSKGWLIVVEPLTLVVGPLLGLLVGSVAGARPAIRATAIEPASSLRGL